MTRKRSARTAPPGTATPSRSRPHGQVEPDNQDPPLPGQQPGRNDGGEHPLLRPDRGLRARRGRAHLARTGQTTTYAPDDDGSLRTGVAWPEPRFTNPDGTVPVSGDVVVDRLTGLMWTRDVNSPGPDECGPGTWRRPAGGAQPRDLPQREALPRLWRLAPPEPEERWRACRLRTAGCRLLADGIGFPSTSLPFDTGQPPATRATLPTASSSSSDREAPFLSRRRRGIRLAGAHLGPGSRQPSHDRPAHVLQRRRRRDPLRRHRAGGGEAARHRLAGPALPGQRRRNRHRRPDRPHVDKGRERPGTVGLRTRDLQDLGRSPRLRALPQHRGLPGLRGLAPPERHRDRKPDPCRGAVDAGVAQRIGFLKRPHRVLTGSIYWSSTTIAGASAYAWIVRMEDGAIWSFDSPKTS